MLVVAGAAGSLPRLQLQVFSLEELKFPNASTMDALRAAVFDIGMLAVTGFDGGSQHQSEGLAFAGALQAFVRCARAGHLRDVLHEVELKDRTVRSTIATATNHSIVAPLPAAVGAHCPEFSRAAASLRRAVDMTGRVYGRVLDRLIYGVSPERQVSPRDGASFVSAVLSAESLEHFHMFTRPADVSTSPPDEEQASLEMHTDMGLFIVMTAAEYLLDSGERLGLDQSNVESGLRLELRNGQVVVPLFPADSLLVMNGEGSHLWMRGADTWADRPHAPAHEVWVPNITGMVRTWFGRMFFPPRDAVLQSPESPGLRFGEYRDQTYDAFHKGTPGLASTLGCSPTRRILMDEGSCGADEMLCWMTCMSSAHLNCSAGSIVCGDPSVPGSQWPQDYLINGQPTHCFNCQLECAGSPPAPPSASGFCNDDLTATTMWMTGFQFVKGSSYPCVAYLFPEWSLNSAVKFAFACIGTFLMGVTIPALTYSRTFIGGSIPSSSYYERAGKQALLVGVYAVHMTLAYWLMLIVMTYQAELFIAAVLGLTFGYWLFCILLVPEVEKEDCAKHVEPCCSA